MVLETIWYSIFIVIVMGYIVLDGFDLGVGMLHPFARGDKERRIFLNAIGPVWDGNEVWLVILIGSLFAGFPFAYATLLSAFYIPTMGLIAGLISRAVAIEFRSKRESPTWRSIWDWVFAIGSMIIALGLGLALGNLIVGLPLDAFHEFTGSFATFFRPYPILVSVTTLTMLLMHGSIYLVMKTEDDLHDRLRRWALRLIVLFFIFYAVTTIATLIFVPHMIARQGKYPWLFAVALVNLLAIFNIRRSLKRGHDGYAFLSSVLNIAALVALYAIGTFPYLIRSTVATDLNSLTIANSYASIKTLKVLLIIVIIGIPLALAYLISIYHLFRGKVRIDSTSY